MSDATKSALPELSEPSKLLSRVLHELAGAASLCWNPKPAGVFDSQQAIAFVEQAIAELRTAIDAAVAEARAEIAKLKTVMIAAAEEIAAHWEAHCDAEGYGPQNLMRRLEEGIPSEYGYTAGAFAELKAKAEARAVRDDGMPARQPERHLRRLLAGRVNMPHAYYDDGEAHGMEHGISIDFMREPVADIDAKLRALGVARYECELAATPSPTPPARVALSTPDASLPPIGEGPRRKINVTVEVPENWEQRLDMQWVLEREIHADRWSWNWPPARVALSDEQIKVIACRSLNCNFYAVGPTVVEFARAVIAEYERFNKL